MRKLRTIEMNRLTLEEFKEAEKTVWIGNTSRLPKRR